MDSFLKYLQSSKQSLDQLDKYETVQIVLGNESCDLDSTVAALALSYKLEKQNEKPNNLILPVMNLDEKYFPLRTETCFLLKENGIDLDILIFKNNIDFQKLCENRAISTSLVDHHVLSKADKILEKTVVEIFDHRPINAQEICKNPNIKTTIKPVGSCCTLIAREILSKNPSILFQELSQLLYATIIYDTIGLDQQCGKTTADDITVAEELEKILKPQQSRKSLFDFLWKIHNDISGIKAKDLLYRDLKIVKNIPIPALPLLVASYLKIEGAVEAVQSFAKELGCENVVLVGIDASNGVKRDIGLYSTNKFNNVFLGILTNNSDLLLTEVRVDVNNFTCFQQGNIKLTRKYIVPLVEEAATKCTSC